jgi:hypothetical protein
MAKNRFLPRAAGRVERRSGVPRRAEQHHRTAGDPAQLGQSPGLVGPVVQAQDRHRGGEGSTATTRRSPGSCEPVPAPTFTTLAAAPSACST